MFRPNRTLLSASSRCIHAVLFYPHCTSRFVRTAPCSPKPPPLLSKPSLLCPCRPCCSHAVPVVAMPPSASPKPSPVPPEPPPFSVKTTINRAPKRYFYAPFAPNEKNFVYLHSLSGRISTSFIGCRAVAQEGGDGSGGPKPRTQDYGSGYPVSYTHLTLPTT